MIDRIKKLRDKKNTIISVNKSSGIAELKFIDSDITYTQLDIVRFEIEHHTFKNNLSIIQIYLPEH